MQDAARFEPIRVRGTEFGFRRRGGVEMRVFDAGIGEEIGDELSFAGSGILDDDPVEVFRVD